MIRMKNIWKNGENFKTHVFILSLRKPLGKLFLGIIKQFRSIYEKRLLDVYRAQAFR
jgi:hypothetical protein